MAMLLKPAKQVHFKILKQLLFIGVAEQSQAKTKNSATTKWLQLKAKRKSQTKIYRQGEN